MTKSELIKAVAKRNPNIPMETVMKMVNCIFVQMVNALKEGHRIELRGFGSFSVRKRAARLARNPRNNEVIDIGDRYVVYFRMGKDFRDRINA